MLRLELYKVRAVRNVRSLTRTTTQQRIEWRWRLKAKNHLIIAQSSEGYLRRRDLFDNIRTVLLCAVAKTDQGESKFALRLTKTVGGHFIRAAVPMVLS